MNPRFTPPYNTEILYADTPLNGMYSMYVKETKGFFITHHEERVSKKYIITLDDVKEDSDIKYRKHSIILINKDTEKILKWYVEKAVEFIILYENMLKTKKELYGILKKDYTIASIRQRKLIELDKN
jgi:hypothetical protein